MISRVIRKRPADIQSLELLLLTQVQGHSTLLLHLVWWLTTHKPRSYKGNVSSNNIFLSYMSLMSCFLCKHFVYLFLKSVKVSTHVFWSILPTNYFVSQVPSRKMISHIIWWTHKNLLEGYLRRIGYDMNDEGIYNNYNPATVGKLCLLWAYRGRERTVRWAQNLEEGTVAVPVSVLSQWQNTLTKTQHKGESICIAHNCRSPFIFEESQGRHLRLSYPQSNAEVNNHTLFFCLCFSSYLSLILNNLGFLCRE